MNSAPIICFGQQPCGFFPKRFLVAKIQTARRLQQEIGGEIVFFLHDSDHDPRETKTVLRDLTSDITPVLVDVSPTPIISAWTAAMEAHASQTNARRYIEWQLARARLHGLAAGVEHALPLFPSDALVVNSLRGLERGARNF